MFEGQFLKDVRDGAGPDCWNSRWSQCGSRFGAGMAIELEVGELLHSMVRAVKPAVIVETGTHRGVSTAVIAQALKENGAGHLYTIDVVDFGVPTMLAEYGLEKHVTYIQGDSRTALRHLLVEHTPFDFLWLDALHDTDFVMAELESALPALRSGFYVSLHDTTSSLREGAAIRAIRSAYPSWEYIHFRTARGFGLMRLS